MVYIMYMYVNKRVELAQRGIALQKMYVLLYIYKSDDEGGLYWGVWRTIVQRPIKNRYVKWLMKSHCLKRLLKDHCVKR